MKHVILSLLALLFIGGSIAQTNYESSHVKDGKTFQYTIPKGYFFVENSDDMGDAMFIQQEGADYNEVSPEELGMGILMVMHERADDETSLQIIQEGLVTELMEVNEKLIVLEKPSIVQLSGREFMRGGFKGEMEGDKVEGLYFGVTRFGDYYVFLSYYAPEGVSDVLAYEAFKKIMASWKEVATTKEDRIAMLEIDMEDFEDFDEDEDMDELEDLEVYYQNNLFKTDLSYYDILPDFGQNWYEPIDESGHLLSMFIYNEDNGSIKIFSGGKASNYPTDKEKADAIQRAMDCPTRMTLKADSGFSNEDHVFKLYSISGGGTMTSVYTTVVNDELVFFVVDGGSIPVSDFKPAVRDLMLTMWIDYFDEEEIDEEVIED